jgi:hypothetical protein
MRAFTGEILHIDGGWAAGHSRVGTPDSKRGRVLRTGPVFAAAHAPSRKP